MRTFYLLLYYGVARHLPKSTFPVIGRMAYRLRYCCARHLFAVCGESVNVEQGAYIGNGKSIRVGNNVGIGKDFCLHSRELIVNDRLLMGENVLIQGGHTPSQTLTALSVMDQTPFPRRWRLQEMYG